LSYKSFTTVFQHDGKSVFFTKMIATTVFTKWAYFTISCRNKMQTKALISLLLHHNGDRGLLCHLGDRTHCPKSTWGTRPTSGSAFIRWVSCRHDKHSEECCAVQSARHC